MKSTNTSKTGSLRGSGSNYSPTMLSRFFTPSTEGNNAMGSWYFCNLRELRGKGETIILVCVTDWQKFMVNLFEHGFELVSAMPIPSPKRGR